MNPLSASEAKSWLQLPYEFRGLFYKSGEQKCRRLLEIREIGYKGEPDLMVIMMNPGGSKPKDEQYVYREYKRDNFTATYPDDTQWEVIDFMRDTKLKDKKPYKYARILNLSDICNPNSVILKKKTVDACPNYANACQDIHTYFNKDADVLLAWGCNNIFKFIIDDILYKKRLFNDLKGTFYGFLHAENAYQFLHPLAKKKDTFANGKVYTWLEGVKPIDKIKLFRSKN